MRSYTDFDALYVFDRMCAFHRGSGSTHVCGNPNACARAGRLAAWLEGTIEENDEWLHSSFNWVDRRGGERWLGIRNRLLLALDHLEDLT